MNIGKHYAKLTEFEIQLIYWLSWYNLKQYVEINVEHNNQYACVFAIISMSNLAIITVNINTFTYFMYWLYIYLLYLSENSSNFIG